MSLERDQKDYILNAGNHTVFIEAEIELEDGPTKVKTGTGFFVSSNLILTAKHNIVFDEGDATRIAIKYEGLKMVKTTDPTLLCQVHASMPSTESEKLYPLEDLAILECPGHQSPCFLRLSTETMVKDMVVHVIGYPGDVTANWLTSRHESLKGDPKSNIKIVQDLLPPRMLTVTEGKISDAPAEPGCATYEVSTVPGMSGGCLLYQDKVCGISPTVWASANGTRGPPWTQAEHRCSIH